MDYRVGDAAINAITMGLEDWPIREMRRVPEPSLQKVLNVTALRAPPVTTTDVEGNRTAPSIPPWTDEFLAEIGETGI